VKGEKSVKGVEGREAERSDSMRRVVRALRAFHRDEGGVQGLELLLIVAAIVLPLLGLLIIFRNELWQWVQGLWSQTLSDGQATP
jgi:Flp pilus assembly pilin Flp